MATPEKVVVELPSRLATELAEANQEVLLTDLLQRGLRDLHIEQALERYKQGGMSSDRCGRLLPQSNKPVSPFLNWPVPHTSVTLNRLLIRT